MHFVLEKNECLLKISFSPTFTLICRPLDLVRGTIALESHLGEIVINDAELTKKNARYVDIHNEIECVLRWSEHL